MDQQTRLLERRDSLEQQLAELPKSDPRRRTVVAELNAVDHKLSRIDG
jgi:CRISPR/Cas system-associated protein Csm6